MGASSENKTAEHWGWISQKRNSIYGEDQQPLTVACKATNYCLVTYTKSIGQKIKPKLKLVQRYQLKNKKQLR
jgi:hypothetical protein